MATSDIDICASALIKLGAQPIQSFTAPTDDARICANQFPDFRRTIQTYANWRFNMRKAKLTLNTEAPINEWTKSFQLPPDRIGGGPKAVFNSANTGARPIADGWEVFGGELFTNQEEIWVDYRVDLAVGEWPDYFTLFAIDFFAARIAVPVTDQVNMKEAMSFDAFGPPGRPELGTFDQAKRIDAQQNPHGVIQTDSPIITARLGRRGSFAGRN